MSYKIEVHQSKRNIGDLKDTEPFQKGCGCHIFLNWSKRNCTNTKVKIQTY